MTDARHTFRSLLAFTGLAYGLTWTAWGGAAWLFPDRAPFGLLILGGLGPLVAAVVVSAVEGGWAGVAGLFRQLKVRVPLRLMLLLLAAIVALRMVPLLFVVATGRVLTPPGMEAMVSVPIMFIFVALVGGGLDEEAGWRGFAQPRLQKIVPPLPASLIIGLVWSFWHLPLWWFSSSVHSQLSLPVYVVSTTALSVLLAHVFNSTRGSLLAVVLVHAASNTADNLRYAVGGVENDPALMLPLQVVLAVTMVAAATAVAMASRGRLGTDPHEVVQAKDVRK
jgi:membrane protease YdiL (CAAX protease family)